MKSIRKLKQYRIDLYKLEADVKDMSDFECDQANHSLLFLDFKIQESSQNIEDYISTLNEDKKHLSIMLPPNSLLVNMIEFIKKVGINHIEFNWSRLIADIGRHIESRDCKFEVLEDTLVFTEEKTKVRELDEIIRSHYPEGDLDSQTISRNDRYFEDEDYELPRNRSDNMRSMSNPQISSIYSGHDTPSAVSTPKYDDEDAYDAYDVNNVDNYNKNRALRIKTTSQQVNLDKNKSLPNSQSHDLDATIPPTFTNDQYNPDTDDDDDILNINNSMDGKDKSHTRTQKLNNSTSPHLDLDHTLINLKNTLL